jgi:hypothetical protein
MADNTLQQENKSVATEDIGGNQVQRVKIISGAFGVDGGNIDDANPMSVDIPRIRIAQGLEPGMELVNILGINPDVDIAAPEDVWLAGGTFTFPPAAEIFSITSSDNADTNITGAGAWTALVKGLDATGVAQSETVLMNGTAGVSTVSTYLHIQSIDIILAGASVQNDGVITCTGVTSALVVASFPIGQNNSNIGMYVVPLGKTAYVTRVVGSATRKKSSSATITLRTRPPGVDVFHSRQSFGIADGSFEHTPQAPPVCPALTQMKWTAEVSDNDTQVGVDVDMLLIDD